MNSSVPIVKSIVWIKRTTLNSRRIITLNNHRNYIIVPGAQSITIIVSIAKTKTYLPIPKRRKVVMKMMIRIPSRKQQAITINNVR
jgi:hypothetical protein